MLTLDGLPLSWPAGAPLDERIGRVIEHQHGVISTAQLGACGLSRQAVAGRIVSGRLRRIHRGVYAVGHTHLAPYGPVAAALLACGGGAASYRTGAWLRSLRHDGRRMVDVTVGHLTGRRHGWVWTHAATSLRAQDVSIIDGLPVTTVARTLLDCAPGLGRRGTEKLVAGAERIGSFDLAAVRDLLAHRFRMQCACRPWRWHLRLPGLSVPRRAVGGGGRSARLTRSDVELPQRPSP